MSDSTRPGAATDRPKAEERFAAHALWVVAVVIIAIGLGYLAANSRRDRGDAVNQRQEDELDTARRG
jgi:cytochrome c-type biogenesis protein CcmH/NrfF